MIDSPLWSAEEMNTIYANHLENGWYADGVQIDSRDVVSGDLFIALKGSSSDGHQHVLGAFAQGAVSALVSRTPEGVDSADSRLIYVQDTVEAMRELATAARKRVPAKIVAVTGSVGKTSVVQALRKSLQPSEKTHSSIRSFNNYTGIPLSLARMPRSSQYGVFEVGMNRPGEILEGGNLIAPNIVVLTTIGSAHVGNFENEDAIVDEKISIIDTLQDGGIAIVGIDNPHAAKICDYAISRGVRVITVSAESPADVSPRRMTERHDCTCLTADVSGVPVTYKIAQPGREWVLNSLLVLATVQALDADLGQAAITLASLEAEPGRGRTYTLAYGDDNITILDDSYNASPLSIRAALRRLRLSPVCGEGRRIAVLADMQELGDKSADIHMSLVSDLKEFGVDRVIAFGDHMAAVGREAGIRTENWPLKENVAERLWERLVPGDSIMIKGANSARLGDVVAGLLQQSKADTTTPFMQAGGW
ncbi:UDP-N-acetylmuramoyl-tripeptide--D-alanyl-D-alanine ligase [Kordiimonas pumila]|uniref:UDP-N-acetylmuramoyl-tripeptide--D-alanyl-D-alanine ligase n=1 Tax=Kordiimonas pumila TaxID=2161677 RepID=A0ABV7D7D6_9PROT|nr:UDP-N-acetylmuramoyl-tripeptide--D-alanyl-D-alanine ligase [Kordiimonas pumila]